MRSSVEVSACPLCGSDALAPLPVPTRTVGRELFAGCAPPLGLRACRACTFAFVSPRPDPATLVRFYQRSDYTAHEPVDGTAATRRARLQLDEVDRAGLPVTGEHVLDLGCGGGHLLLEARARGAEVLGFDVGEHAEAACRRLGLAVTRDEAVVRARRFGGVVMSHVLEHVPDLDATLALVRAVLHPGGWVCIEVPNVASLRARLSPPRVGSRLGLDERYRAFPIHLSYFSPATLRRLLVGAGFDVVAMATVGLGVDGLVPRRAPTREVIATAAASRPAPARAPGRAARARALVKRTFHGALLGENLIAVALRV